MNPSQELPTLAGGLDSSPVDGAGLPAPAGDAQLVALQRELEACRTELQEFTYTVSHDLRAPLRHINAFAQIIEEDWPDMPAEMAGHLATIRRSAQLLAQQLDGLTALSRLAQQPMHLVPVCTDTLVRHAVATASQAAAARQIDWQIAPDLPQPCADAAMLQQVLGELLDNAVKFTRTRQLAQIAVLGTAAPDGQVSLTVSDNGVGFKPEQAAQLFKVFARLHPARDFEGLGLGLVTCRKLMARMGGQIEISAQPGGGCRVQLRFLART